MTTRPRSVALVLALFAFAACGPSPAFDEPVAAPTTTGAPADTLPLPPPPPPAPPSGAAAPTTTSSAVLSADAGAAGASAASPSASPSATPSASSEAGAAAPAPTSSPPPLPAAQPPTYSPPVTEDALPPPSAWTVAYPTGTWVYNAEYGWIWVPNGAAPVAVEGVPYVYLYTPTWGWTWYVSPWGVGPYHYGVWVRRPWRPVGWGHVWVARPHVVIRLGAPRGGYHPYAPRGRMPAAPRPRPSGGHRR